MQQETNRVACVDCGEPCETANEVLYRICNDCFETYDCLEDLLKACLKDAKS